MKDLIDDNPIEEESDSGSDSDDSRGNFIHFVKILIDFNTILYQIVKGHTAKRKKSDDEDDELDDRLEDEDYDLIEENLGVKVERVSFFIYQL